MKIKFVSKNTDKFNEIKKYFSESRFDIQQVKESLNEIQTLEEKVLLESKVIEAFEKVSHPLFVEHTGLYIDHLQGFPGGLTQIFWDKLGPDVFTDLFKNQTNKKVIAKTTICFCDGKKLKSFEGTVEGLIADKPMGNRDFQWDCIFIPDGYDRTFAQLKKKKEEISMRRLALDSFKEFLEEHY